MKKTQPKRSMMGSFHSWVPVGIIIFLILAFLYRKYSSPSPEFPPLLTDPGDPLMNQALGDAKKSIPTFLGLLGKYPEAGIIKLYFLSNTEQVEHLWAEVIGREGDDKLRIRLLTPPVTHKGILERVYTCELKDVEDWQIQAPDGKYHGGFTQKAMFQIARRDGVKLPKKLMEIESRYNA